MPSSTEKQRKAAGADLARVRAGKKARTFTDASIETLREFARKPKKRRT